MTYPTLEACMESVAWKLPEGLHPFRLTIGESTFYTLSKTAHQAMLSACEVTRCSQQDAWEAMHRLSLSRRNDSSDDCDNSPPSTPASSAK